MNRQAATNWEALPVKLSVKEAADALGMGLSTLYKAIQRGEFPVRRLYARGEMFFSRDALRDWLEQPTSQTEAAPTERAAA